MSFSKWLFAFWYDALNSSVEWRLKEYRKATAGRVGGRVLEIGGGTGANLGFFPRDIELTTIEPNPYMARQLAKRARKRGIPVTIVPDVGERMSFADDSFDSVVTTLVQCMVQDVEQVLEEVRRVLKPGGTFHFYEHVVSRNRPFRHALENRFNPVWKWWTTGCNLNRDIEGAIRAAGFREVEVERFTLSITGVPLTLPNIIGTAKA